jgi:hypothetical protein
MKVDNIKIMENIKNNTTVIDNLECANYFKRNSCSSYVGTLSNF